MPIEHKASTALIAVSVAIQDLARARAQEDLARLGLVSRDERLGRTPRRVSLEKMLDESIKSGLDARDRFTSHMLVAMQYFLSPGGHAPAPTVSDGVDSATRPPADKETTALPPKAEAPSVVEYYTVADPYRWPDAPAILGGNFKEPFAGQNMPGRRLWKVYQNNGTRKSIGGVATLTGEYAAETEPYGAPFERVRAHFSTLEDAVDYITDRHIKYRFSTHREKR